MSIWQDNTKTIPKDDPRIIRVDLSCSETGARKSQLPKAGGRNDNSIKHVKGA